MVANQMSAVSRQTLTDVHSNQKLDIKSSDRRDMVTNQMLAVTRQTGPDAPSAILKINNFVLAESSPLDVKERAVVDIQERTPNETQKGEAIVNNNLVVLEKQLGATVRVQVVYFKGEPRIDIRHWTKNEAEEWRPTKKGVSLPLQRWVLLSWLEDRIRKCLQKIKDHEQVEEQIHVSGPVFVQLNSPFWTVHIREWYKDAKTGKTNPTHRGIVLKHGEWDRLMKLSEEINKAIPEIANTRPCAYEDDHQNQTGMLMCKECNPFDYGMYTLD